MKRFSVSLLIFAVVASIAGGVAGSLLARQYLWSSIIGLPLGGEIPTGGEGQQLVIQPRNVVVEYNDRIQAVAQEMRTHVVSLYPEQSVYQAQWETVFGTTTEQFFAYHKTERLGEALVVTNDGWLVTSIPLSDLRAAVAIDSQGRRYALENAVTDPVTGVQFVRAVDADWSAAPFAQRGSIAAGTSVVSMSGEEIGNTIVQEVIDGPVIHSTEVLYGTFALKDAMQPGAIITQLNGEVVGIEAEDGMVVPAHHIATALPMLLAQDTFSRPRLGIRYFAVPQSISVAPVVGAVISGTGSQPAIVPQSPAAAAGLQAGDYITAVNGSDITADYSLSWAVQSRRAGSTLTLTVQRRGVERDVDVTLDAMPASVRE